MIVTFFLFSFIPSFYALQLEIKPLINSQTVTYQGMNIDVGVYLSWNQHIHMTAKSKGHWAKGIRQAAYQTQVRLQIEYACPVCSPYTQTNVCKIETAQRRARHWVSHDYSSYK